MSSNNLVEMTGNEDYSIATLFNDEEVASNERDTSNYLTSHDLDAKQEKLEQIETFNLFSQLGLQLSELLNKVFSSILDKITGLVESALS